MFLLSEPFKSSDLDDAICSSDGISEEEFSMLTGNTERPPPNLSHAISREREREREIFMGSSKCYVLCI